MKLANPWILSFFKLIFVARLVDGDSLTRARSEISGIARRTRRFALRHCALLLLAFAPLASAQVTVGNLSFTGDSTGGFTYDIYRDEALIFSFDNNVNVFGGAGATTANGGPALLVLNFSDTALPVSCGTNGCAEGLFGSGTLRVLSGAPGPSYGVQITGGALGGPGSNNFIYVGAPGISTTATMNFSYLPTGSSTVQYLILTGNTLASRFSPIASPVFFCVPDPVIGMCNPVSTYTPGADQFSSFALDWTGTISDTPFLPPGISPVPEPSTWLALVVGLIGLSFGRRYLSRANRPVDGLPGGRVCSAV
jgi:hypothetical protein